MSGSLVFFRAKLLRKQLSENYKTARFCHVSVSLWGTNMAAMKVRTRNKAGNHFSSKLLRCMTILHCDHHTWKLKSNAKILVL